MVARQAESGVLTTSTLSYSHIFSNNLLDNGRHIEDKTKKVMYQFTSDQNPTVDTKGQKYHVTCHTHNV